MSNQIQQPISSAQSQIRVLPRVGDLLKRSWQIYKARIRSFLGIMTPYFISSLLLIPSESFLLIIGGIIISAWSLVSLLYVIKEREQKIEIKEAFQIGWYEIIPFIWVLILSYFIILGGTLLLIIPGIIFTIWFLFAVYVLISEDIRGINALFRSKQLVSGYWWEVFWRFLVITVIGAVVYLPIQTLKIPFTEKIVDLFLIPFLVTYIFLIYEDLRKIKSEIPFVFPKKEEKIKYILVGIIGFLLIPGILVWRIFETKVKVRDIRREIDVGMIQTALEFYYQENEIYPTTLEQLIPYYFREVPKDPKTNLPYEYKVFSEGKDYEICIDFEKIEDKCVGPKIEEIK